VFNLSKFVHQLWNFNTTEQQQIKLCSFNLLQSQKENKRKREIHIFSVFLAETSYLMPSKSCLTNTKIFV